jgi:catechol 2,3-dioxygenase-like lactoylglutathione lyase family enzyme
MEKVICGIQQIGIGVTNVYETWKWYKEFIGTDIRIFEDSTVAELMLPYTGGQPRERHAALTVNLQGGGGLEIWQYKGRTPLAPSFDVQIGDLGIYAIKFKCRNINVAYKSFVDKGVQPLTPPQPNPAGIEHFFVRDPFNNIFEVFESTSWFKNDGKPTGGVAGAIIGVSNIDKSLEVYSNLLGYDKILSDLTGNYTDLIGIPGGTGTFRRMLLTHSKPRKGAFSPLFGETQIELIQDIEQPTNKIFKDRLWGDLGFIHLCFDIRHMERLEKECNELGYPFTVNSNVKHNEKGSFDMGEAAGHFTYIEDPDGTLIEFVETHRVPLLKALGINLNLDKRDPERPLPNWIINMMGLKKVKGL